MANQHSSTAEKKSKKGGANCLKPIWDLIKRPKSANAVVNPSNLNRGSVSAPGVHDPVPGNDAGTAEPTAARSNATSHQDPTAPSWSARPPLSSVPHLVDSTVSQGAQPAVTETATAQAKQEHQIPAIPKSLPSQVDDTLGACPRFRIVLVGKSGVGKSSLIANVFNIDKDKIDIAHGRAGDADIEYEYTSIENPRFILHDSMGFEPGSDGNWQKVQKCLEKRQGYDLPGKIHAIWFCVVTPRTGARLLQTGDEKLLQLAKEFHIPIIAAFTKYDLLINQFFQEDSSTAEEKALASFDRSVKDLQEELMSSIPCVKVSTKETSAKQMLINLTKVTREELKDIERELEVLWVTAQQVNARQKVEVSISEGFKKYWRDLGQSSAFEGQILIDCIHRLHDDVLKVWNFNDPTGILSGINFFTEIIGLVKPLVENEGDETSFRPAYVPVFGTGGAKELVSLLQHFGLSSGAIHYLYDRYQQYPSTAKLLATYIINLVLVLHGIFTDTLPSDPPRELSNDVVFKVVKDHKTVLDKEALDDIDSVAQFTTHPEQVIESEIRKRLPPDSAAGGVALS